MRSFYREIPTVKQVSRDIMKKNTFIVFAFAALLALCASCVQPQYLQSSPNASISNEKYARLSGTYSANLGCSLFEADKAVRAAAPTLNLHELSRENRISSIHGEYKDVYDTRVTVRLDADPNGQAVISIKFAKTGDKEFSQKFLAAIDEALLGK